MKRVTTGVIVVMLSVGLAVSYRENTEAYTGTNELVSVSTGGTQANNYTDPLSTSVNQDGRYIAFSSYATNLVSGDTNADSDIFLRDRSSGTTIRVSVSSSGVQANSGSFDSRISESGKYVVYSSYATNLIDGSTLSGTRNIYLYSVANATTQLVGSSSAGAAANDVSSTPDVTTDGRFVVFASRATNLVSGSGGMNDDIFVKDTKTGTIRAVTVGNASSYVPRIDCLGRFITFGSPATNLVTGDTNGKNDVFLADALDGFSKQDITIAANSDSGGPEISCNGNYISFVSNATNIVAGDTNAKNDVFRYDRLNDISDRSSLTYSGGQANDDGQYPDISGDGRYVVYYSSATNLVASDTNSSDDVFIRDMVGNTTALVAGTSGGQQANAINYMPSISADGQYVGYNSDATNLVSGDVNGRGDTFISATGLSACTF